MEEILDQAWYEERNVIAVAHHNLLDESRIYEKDCTIEHSDELERFLDDWDVELFLSGHLHVQHYRTSENHDIDEIVTGALTTSPCPYGVLNYKGPGDFTYHTEKVDVSSWAEKKDNPDTNLQNFEEYADEFLQNVFYRHAKADLEQYSISQEEKEKNGGIVCIDERICHSRTCTGSESRCGKAIKNISCGRNMTGRIFTRCIWRRSWRTQSAIIMYFPEAGSRFLGECGTVP